MVCVLGFALRPDFLGAAGIILVGEDEVEPGCRFPFVLDVYFKLFSSFCWLGEVHAKLVVAQFECGVFAVDAGAGNGKVRAIKVQMGQAVAQGSECVGYFTDHATLIEVKAQRDAHILQMIVTTRRIGPVRAHSHGERRADGEGERSENRGMGCSLFGGSVRMGARFIPEYIHACLTGSRRPPRYL